ncbi:aldehyde dehydrogenase [Chlorella sorokiniana]|uniref:Aldehyde dehydrogenase n=1 Tax=Chlorella sorokiniana TaxID=3076 RepID=A0A2P6TKS7_CHLSO|nr:aldehyde dehydrogenase [Chlorella sorokiniana]|eukprot:PRW44891.1 aldehyde dehydrogenase [Chlorella sorokiniana]
MQSLRRSGAALLRGPSGLTSFWRAISTQAAEALKTQPSQLFIDGKFVDAASGKKFDVLDPTTGEAVFQVAEADAADVDKAVKAARRAFDQGEWPRMSGKQRGKILYRLAELIEQHAEELAHIESLDNGKPVVMSKIADIPLSADHFRYFAGWADKLTGKTIPCDNVFGKFFAYTLHEPLGVVGQIIPWNFPLLMLAWKVAPALAAGNCVVLKPAEQTPLNALRFAQLCNEAGIPPGTINILPGFGPTAGGAICDHPGVDKLAFTGSTEIGKLIMAAGAKRVVPVTLELGGKSPLIVDKNVDVDKAVEDTHFALFFNHGQCCAAGSRTFVHADIYDEFVEKAAKRAAKRKVGDPFSDVEQGPQVDEDQLKKILGYIDVAQREGARLLTGGKQHGSKGYFVEPTVFADVTDEMTIAQEEIFGPVQSILKYHTTEEVIERANANCYGLASGIISNDINFINTVSRSLKAGTVWVNCYNVYESAVPFGGYKMSGIGRDKGAYALEHYTQTKAVYQALEPNQPWLLPRPSSVHRSPAGMGQLMSKKPKLEINDVDRAVLTLKSQARKLEQQRTRIQGDIDRERQIAKELVAQGRKDRALLALKRRKLQEVQAERLDGWLLNVQGMLLNIETTKNQQQLFAALKEGNKAVKDMQQAMPLEEVDKLMQDSADAKAYADELNQMLGESLNPEQQEAAEAELEELEKQMLEEQRLEMPAAPGRPLPAVPATEEEEKAAAAAEATAAQLAQLPSVPGTTVAAPTAAAAEEEGPAGEQEREAALVSA